MYPDGTIESWNTLNAYAVPTVHTLRNGATERFDFDASGRLLTHWLPTYSTPDAKITYTYYEAGHAWQDRVKTRTDPLGRVTNFEYDVIEMVMDTLPGEPVYIIPVHGRGLVTKIIHPDGSQRQFRYNAYGNLLSETDETGRTTHHEYDAYQRITMTTDPLGRRKRYSYHPGLSSPYASTFHMPRRIITPGGKIQDFVYDSSGRLVSKTDAVGTGDEATTRFTYNTNGDLETVTDPVGRVTHHAYDSRGRLSRITKPGGRETSWQYDAAGNVLVETLPDGSTIRKTYDAMSRLETRTDEAGRTTRYTYNGLGKVSRVTDHEGRVSGFDYDAEGHITVRYTPHVSGGIKLWQSFTYDKAGNLKTRTDARLASVEYHYDSRDRETLRTYNDGTPQVSTTYDAAGRLLSTSSAVSTIDYTYDTAGQVSTETQRVLDQPARTAGYAYNLDGYRSRLDLPSESLVYAYNHRSQLASLTASGQAVVSYLYFLDGQRQEKILGNGIREPYAYDVAGRPWRLGGAPGGTKATYQYDLRDRKTVVALGGISQWSEVFSYFPDSQLATQKTYKYDGILDLDLEVGANDFTYDGSGNRVRTAGVVHYTTNGANQYIGVRGPPSRTPRYPERRAYTYDAESRVKTASVGARTWTFHHDPLGRLAAIHDGTSFRYALFAGQRPMAWYSGQGQLVEKTYWGPLGDEPLFTHRASDGAAFYYHQDLINNTIATSNTSGVILETYSYDAFGQMRAHSPSWQPIASSTVQPPYRYTGQRWMDEIGLYHYKARMYDAQLGRFLQQDPLGLSAGDSNLYRYTFNNPTNLVDPTGEAIETPWDALNVAIGAASLAHNVAAGNWGEATVDLVGLALDVTATALPGVPGGASMAIQGLRRADNVMEGAQAVHRMAQGIKQADKASVVANTATKVGNAVDVATDAAKGVDTTRVGRWMSEAEHKAMQSTGKVQESLSGTTHVAHPAAPEAFMSQAKPGSVYVKFDVPTSSVRPTQAGWAKIVGPQSLEGRLAAKKGLPIPEMPAATNIEHAATKFR
ncbi:RHS repeat domain-containing protein [Myxococcus vastator]|uniref:RHS repeat domain-containing protein n=1 Tax=Myxococcus vastator TaxID=2709664 RepID=UPI0013D46697|nr:RHS repeat domain-containing protein [Myxococcus vastator]